MSRIRIGDEVRRSKEYLYRHPRRHPKEVGTVKAFQGNRFYCHFPSTGNLDRCIEEINLRLVRRPNNETF